MANKNPIRTLRDYSKPSHEGYRNTIELPVGNNVVPLRSDTIQLVQNEAFEDLVINFILVQEEKVKQLEEYMGAIGSDFMQLSSEVVGKLNEEIRMEENKTKKIEKITRYPDTRDLKPLNGHKFSEALK
ncbi:hypothetical protein Tco_0906111 [Tanacetum coccineum]